LDCHQALMDDGRWAMGDGRILTESPFLDTNAGAQEGTENK
jgi:hypothetical protein